MCANPLKLLNIKKKKIKKNSLSDYVVCFIKPRNIFLRQSRVVGSRTPCRSWGRRQTGRPCRGYSTEPRPAGLHASCTPQYTPSASWPNKQTHIYIYYNTTHLQLPGQTNIHIYIYIIILHTFSFLAKQTYTYIYIIILHTFSFLVIN